jgi:amino acid transporter
LPLEITAAAITLQYWTTSVNVAVWITVFWIAIIIVNIFGTLGYAEEECKSLVAVASSEPTGSP